MHPVIDSQAASGLVPSGMAERQEALRAPEASGSIAALADAELPGFDSAESPQLRGFAQAVAVQHYLVPALLELIRGTYFDFPQLEKIDSFLGHIDTGRAPTRPAYLAPALRMIGGVRLDTMTAGALSDILGLVLGYLNLTSAVGVKLLGSARWEGIAQEWGRAVAAIKAKAAEPEGLPPEPADGVVALAAVGNPGTEAAARAQRQFAVMAGRRIALQGAAQDALRERAAETLRAEFPYASALADAVLGDLRRGEPVALRHRLIWGPPGAGKTRFWVRLCEILGIPHVVYSCGGESDSAFAGAARQWSTGEAAVPVVLMGQHRIANPVIILDEIEKVGTGKHNGNLLDALLGMLGDTTAGCWRDPFLEAPVDLRHVNWLASANSLDGIPSALRDRWVISKFPSPSAAHAPHLVAALWPGVVAACGLDHRLVPALGQDEIEAVTRLWSAPGFRASGFRTEISGGAAEPGLSVRRLKTILERWLQRREAGEARH